jgi:hypothetical protein
VQLAGSSLAATASNETATGCTLQAQFQLQFCNFGCSRSEMAMAAHEYPPSSTIQFIERFDTWHVEVAKRSKSSSYKALYLDNNQKALKDSLHWWACERGWTFDKSSAAVAASLQVLLERKPWMREGLPAAHVAAAPVAVLPSYFRASKSKFPFKINMDGWCKDLWEAGLERVCADVGSVGSDKAPVVSFDDRTQQFTLGPAYQRDRYPKYFWLLFSNGVELCFKVCNKVMLNFMLQQLL